VGFPVNDKVHCPLFSQPASIKNIDEFLAIIKTVAAFRKGQAAKKRAADIGETAEQNTAQSNTE